MLGQEEYGIEMEGVLEIRDYETVTPIAYVPDFIKGVIRVRELIAPVLDMRIKFVPGVVEYSLITTVIIVSMANRVMGMVVDYVLDVIKLHDRRIRPAPDAGTLVNAEYLAGMVVIGGRTLCLLDIEKLMSMVYKGLT